MQLESKKIGVAILGSTGMLGSNVDNFLSKNQKLKVYSSFRNKELVPSSFENTFEFNAKRGEKDFKKIPNDVEYIVNCIGVIKQLKDIPLLDMYRINSTFPLELNAWCNRHNIKLIHVSTDCVFSGATGNYLESDRPDCDEHDHYGRSKFIGEIPETSMVIRSSFIGEELRGKLSFLEWVKSHRPGETINGFTNHYWTGLTAKEFARCLEKIILNDLFQTGIRHIFSSSVSKYEMAEAVNQKYNLGLNINPVEATQEIYRTLATIYDLNKRLEIQSFKDMLDQL